MQKMKKTAKKVVKKVDHFAKAERLIAAVLTLTPLVLFLTDTCPSTQGHFRTSISNYVFMPHSYWFGSLLALAGALFIFNGAQHMSAQQEDEADKRRAKSRFGKGYNILFGVALFGVIYFDHINHTWLHYIFAGIFFVGCGLAMILTRETKLNTLGDVLGILTLLALAVYFFITWIYGEDNHWYTLLWAEWIGLFFIAIYFIVESHQRDLKEEAANLY